MEPDTTHPTGAEWLQAFARELGVGPPSAADVESILALAGAAAHASERAAAPVACWLAARAGVDAAEAARRATGICVERAASAGGGPGSTRTGAVDDS